MESMTQEEYDKAIMDSYRGALQTGQGQDPNSIYADYMREEKVKNILSQLNPDSLLEDIEHRIRGEKKNTLSGEWEKISEKYKSVSEILIGKYISFLGSILNQNTSLSNFNTSEINNLMEMVIEYIRDDLTDNAEEYGIKGKYDEMNRVGNIICMSTFAVFKRAQFGLEARRIFSALKVTESLSQQPQKKGFFDALKFWK